MFHLQARIGLDEIKRVGRHIHQKLKRAQTLIAHFARQRERGFKHTVSQRRIEARRGRDFDHLLMPPLQAAVALAEMRHAALPVAQHLHFDVPRGGNETFGVNGAVAKRGGGFLLTARERGRGINAFGQHLHAAPAAAGSGFENEGGAWPELRLKVVQRGDIRQRAGSLKHRHATAFCQRAGCEFVAKQVDLGGRGANEAQPGGGAGGGKFAVFGQKTIARMDGVALGRFGRRNHRGLIEISARAVGRQGDAVGGAAHVQGVGFIGAVERDRRHAGICHTAREAERNFAAIGDQNTRKTHRATLAMANTPRSPALRVRVIV